MGCFRMLFDHLAWIKNQLLSGIRDPRKAGSLWEMRRGMTGVRKSIHQSWLAKGLALGLLVEVLREFRKRFRQKRPALFKSGQWHFQQDNAPVHNSILVTYYLIKMGIKTVSHRPYNPDLVLCDFWLFPWDERGCSKVIDTLTQEDFYRAFQNLLELYKRIAAGEDYFEEDYSFMRVLSIKVPIRKKSGKLFNPIYQHLRSGRIWHKVNV